MTADIHKQLRDVILLDADFLGTHADLLDQFARGDVARSVLEKRMKVAANACRARKDILHKVLEASQPVVEGS